MKNINKSEKVEFILILSILIMASVLRLVNLGKQSLWIDEINAVLLASSSLFKIFTYGDTASPFIYIINHFWQMIGDSDWMVRFPSLVLGIASIYMIYKLAKVMFGNQEGLLSAFLASISIYHIMYSQEAARPYSAFMLFSLSSFYCFYQILKTDQKKYWRGFLIFSILNFYTHFFAIFVIFGEVLFYVIYYFWGKLKKNSRVNLSLRKFGGSIFKIFIFCLPMVIPFFGAAKSEITGGKVVFNLIYYKNLFCRYGAGNGPAFYVYSLFFMGGVFSLFRGGRKKEAAFLVFMLAFPFLILSFARLSHFFHIRYVIFTYPLYVIMISRGITNLLLFWPRYSNKILYTVIIIFILFAIIPLKLYYLMPARLTDWKGAADYIYKSAKPKAVVITNGVHDILIKYYLSKNLDNKEIAVYSHRNDSQLFLEALAQNKTAEAYYVGYGEDIGYGTDNFSLIAENVFTSKNVFFSPVYLELVKRELIDGDHNSWVDVGVRGYRLVVYSHAH